MKSARTLSLAASGPRGALGVLLATRMPFLPAYWQGLAPRAKGPEKVDELDRPNRRISGVGLEHDVAGMQTAVVDVEVVQVLHGSGDLRDPLNTANNGIHIELGGVKQARKAPQFRYGFEQIWQVPLPPVCDHAPGRSARKVRDWARSFMVQTYRDIRQYSSGGGEGVPAWSGIDPGMVLIPVRYSTEAPRGAYSPLSAASYPFPPEVHRTPSSRCRPSRRPAAPVFCR